MTGGGARELIVLGTSAQVPTRDRNHNGYLLRWDDDAILFDPGEGTQRQLLLAGASTGAISAIAITHLHGDHCLGLPGVLARFVLDQRQDPVDLYFPEAGAEYVERLCRAAVVDAFPHLRLHPLPADGATVERAGHRLVARPLRHSIATLGWRIEEDDHLHLRHEQLDAAGVRGPDVGRLVEDGVFETPEGRVTLEQVSVARPGQRFAFVMDTAPCDEAVDLADGADLVVTESTFLEADASFAHDHLHLTARQAGSIAAEAGARQLVLAHFSARHRDTEDFAREAADVFAEVVAAHDLEVIPVPPPAEV